jgi:DNA-directed RNA polymerase sigma subunit (sigma70/sigma32)
MEQRLSGRGAEMSLDAPMDPDGEGKSSHMDYLVDTQESADEAMGRNELTRERARQIEAKVIQKLREFLKPELRGLED